jgi:DNA-binding NarL/FixJ family response regulator
MMSTAVRRSLQIAEHNRSRVNVGIERQRSVALEEEAAYGRSEPQKCARPRVFVAAENRLLREALSRTLSKSGEAEVIGAELSESFRTEDLLQEAADILLLSSRGSREEDVATIRKVRSGAPRVLILLIDVEGEETEFLQCIRAGVRGYLPKDASAEDVVEAVRAVQAGKAVCPGMLCAALFRYFEREANSFPSAIVHHRLGLTRREQQLIPLIAEGLTNKEIANRFCLSEQTVKNHLYRMKHKIGAEDRLGIVQVCRTQGFIV